MNDPRSDLLRVPGATIYYRMRGSGPLLLLLQGGDGAAEAMDPVADHLVGDYTVVIYDRRGLSRSTLDNPQQAIRLQTHTGDVHHLLAALTSEPVLAFGGSLGALIGLDLVARYPEQVRTLVAHEPPAPQLLPDDEQAKIDPVRNSVGRVPRRPQRLHQPSHGHRRHAAQGPGRGCRLGRVCSVTPATAARSLRS